MRGPAPLPRSRQSSRPSDLLESFSLSSSLLPWSDLYLFFPGPLHSLHKAFTTSSLKFLALLLFLCHTAVKMTFQNHRSRCHLPRGAPSPAGEHLISWGCPRGPLVNVNPPVFPRHGPPLPGLSPTLYSRDQNWFSSSSLCGPILLHFMLSPMPGKPPSLSLFTCQCLLKLYPNLPLQNLDSLTCVMHPFIKVPTTLCWDDLQSVLPYQTVSVFPEGRQSSLLSSATLGPSSGSCLHTIC